VKRPGTAIFSVGDNVGYRDGPASSRVCRLLEENGVRSVLGNHEHWMRSDGRLFLTHPPDALDHLSPEALAWCRELPLRIELEHPLWADLRVVVQHSLFEDDAWDYVNEANAFGFLEQARADVVFAGHSHRPAIYSVPHGPEPASVARLDPASDDAVECVLSRERRFVVDAGSISRPELKRGRPPFPRGTFAGLDVSSRRVSVRAFAKG
jgi:hypothetical protein